MPYVGSDSKTIKIQLKARRIQFTYFHLYAICGDKVVTYIIYVFAAKYIFKSSITSFPWFLCNLISESGLYIVILFININIGWIPKLCYTPFFFFLFTYSVFFRQSLL